MILRDEARFRNDQPGGPVTATFTVAFDWNGTLVDDADRARLAASAVLVRRGLPALDAGGFHEGFCLPLARWFSILGIESRDLAGAVREWNEEVRNRPAELAAGSLQTIRALRLLGARLGVVSAAEAAAVRKDLDHVGLAELVDFVVGGADPKRDALRDLAASSPGGVAYIGDTEYDILEAKAAGAWAIGYGDGYRPAAALAAAGADFVIDRLSELPDLLTRLRDRPLGADGDAGR